MKKTICLLTALMIAAISSAQEPGFIYISNSNIPRSESGKTIQYGEIAYDSRVSLKNASDYAAKRIAMFLIQMNYTPDGEYTQFELKASTNNFAYSLQFYSQSELADTGSTTGTKMDKMHLFVCSSYHNDGPPGFYDNQRSYFYITNTLPEIGWTHQLTTVVVLVDTTCLIRNPEGKIWLEDTNSDLMWSWCRYYGQGNSTVAEKENGTNAGLWRPIMPIRWFSEMPNWAKEQVPSLKQ